MSNLLDRLTTLYADRVPMKPDARYLIRVLRDDDLRAKLLPEFEWYYPDCETCAMGLAKKLWPRTFGRNWEATGMTDLVMWMARVMKLHPAQAEMAFFRATTVCDLNGLPVKPQHVADLLELAV